MSNKNNKNIKVSVLSVFEEYVNSHEISGI